MLPNAQWNMASQRGARNAPGAAPVTEQPLDLHRFGRTLARGKWVLLFCALLGLLGAGAVTYVRSPQYSASALMLLPSSATPSDGNGQSAGQSGPNTDTQVQIARSTDVLAPAAANIHFPGGANQLRRQVAVSAPTPDILKFVGKATTPQSAIAIANAAANSYRAYVAGSATTQNEALLATLRAQANAQNQQLESVNAELSSAQAAKAPGDRVAQLLTQQSTIQNQLNSTNQQIATTELCPQCSTNAFKMLESATTASSDATRTTTRNLAIGGIVGLLVAVAYLVLRETRESRAVHVEAEEVAVPVAETEAVTDVAGAHKVAAIVTRRARTVDDWHSLFANYTPSDDERWSLRRVLRGLLAAEARPPAHVTVVTLAQDVDAVAIAPQLAAFAATAGVKTLLLVNGRDPSVAALRQACRETALAHEPARPNLWVMDGKVDEEEWPAVQLIVTSVVGDQPAHDAGANPSSTLLAISAVAVTPERITAAAAAAAAGQHPWAGVIVANPSPDDGTLRRVADAS